MINIYFDKTTILIKLKLYVNNHSHCVCLHREFYIAIKAAQNLNIRLYRKMKLQNLNESKLYLYLDCPLQIFILF